MKLGFLCNGMLFDHPNQRNHTKTDIVLSSLEHVNKKHTKFTFHHKHARNPVPHSTEPLVRRNDPLPLTFCAELDEDRSGTILAPGLCEFFVADAICT